MGAAEDFCVGREVALESSVEGCEEVRRMQGGRIRWFYFHSRFFVNKDCIHLWDNKTLAFRVQGGRFV